MTNKSSIPEYYTHYNAVNLLKNNIDKSSKICDDNEDLANKIMLRIQRKAINGYSKMGEYNILSSRVSGLDMVRLDTPNVLLKDGYEITFNEKGEEYGFMTINLECAIACIITKFPF